MNYLISSLTVVNVSALFPANSIIGKPNHYKFRYSTIRI